MSAPSNVRSLIAKVERCMEQHGVMIDIDAEAVS